jgi:hypothetical protein
MKNTALRSMVRKGVKALKFGYVNKKNESLKDQRVLVQKLTHRVGNRQNQNYGLKSKSDNLKNLGLS